MQFLTSWAPLDVPGIFLFIFWYVEYVYYVHAGLPQWSSNIGIYVVSQAPCASTTERGNRWTYHKMWPKWLMTNLQLQLRTAKSAAQLWWHLLKHTEVMFAYIMITLVYTWGPQHNTWCATNVLISASPFSITSSMTIVPSYWHTSTMFQSLPWYTGILLGTDESIKDFSNNQPHFKVQSLSDNFWDNIFSSPLHSNLFLHSSNFKQWQTQNPCLIWNWRLLSSMTLWMVLLIRSTALFHNYPKISLFKAMLLQ